MIDRLCADKGQSSLADPPPELNVLVVGICLQTLLGLQVEELERLPLRLESNDGLSQVHDSTVSADRPANDIVRVLEIDDDRLGGSVGFIVLLAHTDVLVRLERLQRISPRASYQLLSESNTYTILP